MPRGEGGLLISLFHLLLLLLGIPGGGRKILSEGRLREDEKGEEEEIGIEFGGSGVSLAIAVAVAVAVAVDLAAFPNFPRGEEKMGREGRKAPNNNMWVKLSWGRGGQ